MSLLDDILKMVDESGDLTEDEKKQVKDECKVAYEMEMAE